MKLPQIKSVTVKDDGDPSVVSVYIELDPVGEMEVNSPTICLLAWREKVDCAFKHVDPSKCEKCSSKSSLDLQT